MKPLPISTPCYDQDRDNDLATQILPNKVACCSSSTTPRDSATGTLGTVSRAWIVSYRKARIHLTSFEDSRHQPVPSIDSEFVAMALAKPVRGLLLVAVVLWCIFLWQMFFTSAPSISGPEGKNVNFDRDPNLDRTQPWSLRVSHKC